MKTAKLFYLDIFVKSLALGCSLTFAYFCANFSLGLLIRKANMYLLKFNNRNTRKRCEMFKIIKRKQNDANDVV